MIAKICYPPDTSIPQKRVSTSIECDRVHCEETKESFTVFLSKNNDVIAEYSFNPADGMDIYLIENGKTVDRLPRR